MRKIGTGGATYRKRLTMHTLEDEKDVPRIAGVPAAKWVAGATPRRSESADSSA